MMCHNKIDLIPLKLSSIIMNLLTPFIYNKFSEPPLYTLLETTDPSLIALKTMWRPHASPKEILWPRLIPSKG